MQTTFVAIGALRVNPRITIYETLAVFSLAGSSRLNLTLCLKVLSADKLITFANSLDLHQARQNMDPKCLTL